MNDDGLNSFLKKNWQVGTVIVAAAVCYANVNAFKVRYEHAHVELANRVEIIEKNGVPPVRERLQATESRTTFVEERIRTLELDAKQSAVLFGEFRSKLDIMGTQLTGVAEWVKQQQRKDK